MSKKNQGHNNILLWIWGIFVISVTALSAWIWFGLHFNSPRFNYMLIRINGELQKTISGETLNLRPNDRVKIERLSTNVPFNMDVRIVARGDFDVGALRYEELPISAILQDRDLFNRYLFRTEVKYRNRTIGVVTWEIQPWAEDWIEKSRTIKDPEKRLSFLMKAHSVMPQDRDIYDLLIDELKGQKRWKQAAQLMEKELTNPPDPDALIDLLDLYTKMSDTKGIISVLKRLVTLNPSDISLRIRLAGILEKDGRYKEAIGQYEAIVNRLEGKDASAVYQDLVFLYTKTGNLKKAVYYNKKAIKVEPDNPDLYYNMSYLYKKMGQESLFYTYLAKALSLKSDDLDSRIQLAHVYLEKGDLKKAEKYVMEVLKKDPGSIDALNMLAIIKDKKGDKKGLIGVYRKILRLEPDNQTVLYNLGLLEYEAGALDKSRQHILKYLKKNHRDKDAHQVLFNIYKKQKKMNEAFKEAMILVRLLPHHKEAYEVIFNHLMAQKEYNRLVTILKRALAANPGDLDLREYLAVACLKAGNQKEAARQIEKILKVRPHDLDLMFDLAELKESEGDISGALEIYKRIITISPDNERAEDAFLRLRLEGVERKEHIR